MQSIQLYVNTRPNDTWQFQSATGGISTFLVGNTVPPFIQGDAIFVDLQGSGTFTGLEGLQNVVGVTGTSIEIAISNSGIGQISGSVSYYPEYIELDLIDTEAIKFTKQVSSIEEPEAITSNYTKNFRLPETSINGNFFKAIFNVNSTNFDPTKKVSSYINIDGVYFTSGDLRLNQIYRNDKRGLIEYDVIFIGETGGFASIVGSKLMKDLDLSDTYHELNYANITQSWNTSGLFGGKVLYPLAEWGYSYSSSTGQPLPEQNTVSRYYQSPQKGFTKSGNPLLQGQFKPIYSVKYLFDKIMKEAGYTYTSNFISEYNSVISDLYHVSTGPTTSGPVLPQTGIISSFYGVISGTLDKANVAPGPSSFYIVPTKNVYQLFDPYSLLITDTGPVTYQNPPTTINFTKSFFKIPYTSQYQIEIKDIVLKRANPGQVFDTGEQNQTIGVYLYKNGNQIDFIQGKIQFTNAQPGFSTVMNLTTLNNIFTFPSAGGSYTLEPGNTVEIRIRRENYIPPGLSNPGYQDLYMIDNGPFECTLYLVAGSNQIDGTAFFPNTYKQIDFIKSLSDKFKLIWEPDQQNPKNFYIEPWVNWIKSGQRKDWTDKLNENKDIIIKPLFQSQPRTSIWKDLSESDVYNFSYQQEYKKGFGEINKTTDIEIISGTRKIETSIAPIQIAPIGLSDTFLVPHFAKDTATERQPIEVVPRFCYYNGLINNPTEIGATGPLKWYMLDDNIVSIPQSKYPLISNYNGTPPFLNQDFDISWDNSKQFWDPLLAPSYGSGKTYQTAFYNYWNDWYNMTYDPYSKIIEAEFALETNDIRGLRFNDRIWIKDSWYFPLEVKDYILNEKQNVTVTLMKVGNIGIQNILYPKRELCYDPTVGCNACCCSNTITVYGGTGPSLPISSINQLFLDSKGNTPAPNGWYNTVGSSTSYYFFSGYQTSTATCSGCSCTPVLFPLNVCDGYLPQDVCCCTSPGMVIYGNGLDIDTSTQLWSDPGGTVPLSPFTWYKETTGLAAQVGADGHTVAQYNNCSGIIC